MEHVIGVVLRGKPPGGVDHVLIEWDIEEGVGMWEELWS